VKPNRVPESNFSVLSSCDYNPFREHLDTRYWRFLIMCISKRIDTFHKSVVILLLFSFLNFLRLIKLNPIVHLLLLKSIFIQYLKSLPRLFILKLNLRLRNTMLSGCWSWSLMLEKVEFSNFWLISFLNSRSLNFSLFLLGRLQMGFYLRSYRVSGRLDRKWVYACVVFHHFKSLDSLDHLNYRKSEIDIFIQTLWDKGMD